MRWRKANRNKKRVQMRSRRRFTAQVGWREWLKKISPNFVGTPIQTNSVMSRIMRGEVSVDRAFLTYQRSAHYGHVIPAGRRGVFPTRRPNPYLLVVDDIDFSKPARPQPTKKFIYGDNWNAYQVIEI